MKSYQHEALHPPYLVDLLSTVVIEESDKV